MSLVPFSRVSQIYCRCPGLPDIRRIILADQDANFALSDSMLAVMTMNVGYFLSVLGGIFLGDLAVGRYVHVWDEH